MRLNILAFLTLAIMSPALSFPAQAKVEISKQARTTRTVYASEAGVILNSDVYKGGGTDQTAAIQEILDLAVEWGRLYFVMDGAALVSKTLRVHSNTTIYCPDKSCGFFLADGSDCSVISNATWGDYHVLKDHDIAIIGGVYNNNSRGQVHDRPVPGKEPGPLSEWVYGMEWYGVENLTLKDFSIVDQRTFACTLAGWKHLVIENVHIDRRTRTDYQNQDGIHLFGPGKHAVLRNIYGNSGDDFIAVAPDEVDMVSEITDVLIDGVYLDDADQGIRILSRAEGRVDRLTIRNVSGTYRSYGFIINPWFEGTGGHFGNIVFENIDLRPMKNNYDYSRPFLFKLGGNIESLTLKDIYHHKPGFNHRFAVIGGAYNRDKPRDAGNPTSIERLIVDGLYVVEDKPEACQEAFFDIVGADVGLISLDKVIISRPEGLGSNGSLVRIQDGTVRKIITGNIYSNPGVETLAR